MLSHLNSVGTERGHESNESLGIQTKTNCTDFATLIDVANEEMISKSILEKFPSHRIIGEESVGTGSIPPLTKQSDDGPPSHIWIIDPVDGTTNFAQGLPQTCVSIGIVDGRSLVPMAGVVYSSATDEMYVAVRGRGSYRNGERIRASPSHPAEVDSLPEKSLSNAVVCFEYGYSREPADVRKMTDAVNAILVHGCRAMRSLGSGVLNLCYVATGRLDVVFAGIGVEGWKPWDYCAAMVVVEEAGCTLRSLHGPPNKTSESEFDEMGEVIPGVYVFDIYSKSMICGVNETVVKECRNVVLKIKQDAVL
mmetsp:Transcript_40796/g.95702  ORF Transcript_40796/g.95702 Transcript_40796/m.95702 type:complete len:308 (-) Transcript_40796:79-1002(-)